VNAEDLSWLRLPLDALTPAQLMREFTAPRATYSITFLSTATCIAPQKLRRRLARVNVIVRGEGVKGPTHAISRSSLETEMPELWSRVRLAIINKIRWGSCSCGYPYRSPPRCVCDERLAVDKARREILNPRSSSDLGVLLRGVPIGEMKAMETRRKQLLDALAKANAAKRKRGALVRGHYGVRWEAGSRGPHIVAVTCKHCAAEIDPRNDHETDHQRYNRGLSRYNRAQRRIVKHLLDKHRDALGGQEHGAGVAA